MVKLQPIKLSRHCTEDILIRYLRLNFFKDVILTELDCGNYIPILSQSNIISRCELFTFCDMNSDWPHLLHYSTLKSLGGCFDGVKLEDINDISGANRIVGNLVANEFGFDVEDGNISLEDCLKTIIIEIKVFCFFLTFSRCCVIFPRF